MKSVDIARIFVVGAPGDRFHESICSDRVVNFGGCYFILSTSEELGEIKTIWDRLRIALLNMNSEYGFIC